MKHQPPTLFADPIQPSRPVKTEVPLQSLEGISHESIEELNSLIIAQHDMKLYDRRIFLKIIEKLPKVLQDFESGSDSSKPMPPVSITINAKEIMDNSELKGGSVITELAKATERLLRHILKVDDETKLLQVSLISSAEYRKGFGEIVISLDRKILPYLMRIKDQFKKEQLSGLMNFRSYYTQCLYELFQREHRMGKDKLYIPVPAFRKLIGLTTEYNRYNDLKKRVLYMAQEELDAHGEIAFTFVEKNHGRKVIGLNLYFTINPKKK